MRARPYVCFDHTAEVVHFIAHVAHGTYRLRRLGSRGFPAPQAFRSSVSAFGGLFCKLLYRILTRTASSDRRHWSALLLIQVWSAVKDCLHVLSWVLCSWSGELVIKFHLDWNLPFCKLFAGFNWELLQAIRDFDHCFLGPEFRVLGGCFSGFIANFMRRKWAFWFKFCWFCFD